MDAVMFLKEWKRMCKVDISGCMGCPLDEIKGGMCRYSVYKEPERAVEIVEKWSKENPMKTIMDDFFEKFPNARKTKDGLPEICPTAVYGGKRDCCAVHDCVECWYRPLEVI